MCVSVHYTCMHNETCSKMFGLMIHKMVENLRQAHWQRLFGNLNVYGINYMAKLMHWAHRTQNN